MAENTIMDDIRIFWATTIVILAAAVAATKLDAMTVSLFAVSTFFSGIITFAPMSWGGRVSSAIAARSMQRMLIGVAMVPLGAVIIEVRNWTEEPSIAILLLAYFVVMRVSLGSLVGVAFRIHRARLLTAGSLAFIMGQLISLDAPLGYVPMIFGVAGAAICGVLSSRVEHDLDLSGRTSDRTLAG